MSDPATPAPPARPPRPIHLHRPRRATTRRAAPVVGLLLAVVGVAVADAVVTVPASAPAPSTADGVPVAPGGSYSSSAFCTGGAAGPDATAGTTIFLTNATARPVRAVMTALVAPGTASGASSSGTPPRPAVVDLVVPARGQTAVNPGAGLPLGDQAASFAFDGGGVAVNQVVTGGNGWSTSPCATGTSDSWYFAGGSTAGGDVLTLALYNPTATLAVTDVSFLTPGGVLTPSPYQGLDVPAGQLVTVNVADHVQGQAEIATVVSAQSGGVVAAELQQHGAGPTGGLALRLGSPEPSTSWQFAQTTELPGGRVVFHVADPGSTPAQVTFHVALGGGRVEPVTVPVAAGSVATFDTSSTARLPTAMPYAVTVSATAPVVVGRTVAAPPGRAAPVWGGSSGTTTVATHWLVPGPGVENAPGSPGATVQSLAVADPGTAPATVTVTVAGSGLPVATFTVAPGAAWLLRSSVVGGLRPFEVRATRPVVVEEDSGPSGAPGIVSSTGLPYAP